MPQLILLNKPFQVMSQFSPSGDKRTLADYIDMRSVYPAGRLDYDSEGLLLLTDSGALQHEISHPRRKMAKTYWAQVEGDVTPAALSALANGVALNDGPTLPAQARLLTEPAVWRREPPIRHRLNIPTSWIELVITEGRNRQVRRMTAAVGFPTLRLIRVAIGPWHLGDLQPGEWRRLEADEPQRRAPAAPPGKKTSGLRREGPRRAPRRTRPV